MSTEFACSIKRIRFDENYQPADNTRLTTNFANLARGESREQNLRNTLRMINNRFNALAQTDNPNGDRYSLEIDIISANLDIEGNGQTFPIIEMPVSYTHLTLPTIHVECRSRWSPYH